MNGYGSGGMVISSTVPAFVITSINSLPIRKINSF